MHYCTRPDQHFFNSGNTRNPPQFLCKPKVTCTKPALSITFSIIKIKRGRFNNQLPSLQNLLATLTFLVLIENSWQPQPTQCPPPQAGLVYDITKGITHVFSCINICRIPRMLFEHEVDRSSVQHHPRDPASVQHHPRDPASVNAMKQGCVIVILAYFTLFQLSSHWKRC